MERNPKHFRKRDAILHCVKSTDVHPSADWVYAQLRQEREDISLATVYRNLALFKQQGTIASVGTVNGVERFDGNTDPHVHFICGRCASVIDLHQMSIPDSLCTQAATYTGGAVDACSLSFTGLCSRCHRNPV